MARIPTESQRQVTSQWLVSALSFGGVGALLGTLTVLAFYVSQIHNYHITGLSYFLLFSTFAGAPPGGALGFVVGLCLPMKLCKGRFRG